MISEKKVREIIDLSEQTYELCWELLNCLIHPEHPDALRNAILTFQSTLAGALQKLNSLFHRLGKEENRLIDRKQKLNRVWFQRRMKRLSEFKEAVNDTFAVGKQLGDSFAWFFFIEEREKFNKHYGHQPQFHGAPGIGGAGEYEFAKNISIVGRNLYLHHCLTTFLSIGDVTLIHLDDFSVSAVGELKSTEVSPGKLNVRLTYLGKDKSKMEFPDSSRRDEKIAEKLPPKIQLRLEKQVKEITNSFWRPSATIERVVGMSLRSQFEALENAVKSALVGQFAYEKLGDGLLLLTYRDGDRSLSKKLLNGELSFVKGELEDLPAQVISITDKRLKDNSLRHGSLIYGDRRETRPILGTRPIFWWPVSKTIIKDLIFKNVILMTWYNPAHLAQKLRTKGYQVSIGRKPEDYKIEKTIGNGSTKIEQAWYFFELVQGQLVEESAVVDLIELSCSEIASKIQQAGEGPAHFNFNFEL